MRRRRSISEEPEGALAEETINVSPLIDVVFILLIFFIVTTVFVRETGIDVERPRAASSSELSREALLIAVDAEGAVFYGGSPLDIRALRSTVKRLLQGDPRPVIIQADRRTSTEDLVAVIDEISLAGAESVNIATRASDG
ncbi:ExbD/TolR family protein [Puniceicoccus vermicola]|uniref:Biopolymer transporter ExbD n=1 Tax=Puniceicoccus vermicola TaxID=388746 RepID=A0A7X1E7E3_9BACT|nr:biopolymer transporter ExbD [Puniceicoccus vermicola]MBC2603637.1 biopolymer transporter ExbD [Puniceicoccus vermicola]